MRLLLMGATGMVGSEVLRQALNDKEISEIVALGRRAVEARHPKLKTVIHQDFMNYTPLRNELERIDACIWCLGVSQLQVSKEEYEIITYEYTLAAAKAMIVANPAIYFVFVSGDGADQTGKTKTLFGRVKGKAEKDLMELPFKNLVIARPAGIKPFRGNPRAPFLYKIFYFSYPIWKILTPTKVITSVDLAKALLYLAKIKTDQVIFNNRELKEMSKKNPDPEA